MNDITDEKVLLNMLDGIHSWHSQQHTAEEYDAMYQYYRQLNDDLEWIEDTEPLTETQQRLKRIVGFHCQ